MRFHPVGVSASRLSFGPRFYRNTTQPMLELILPLPIVTKAPKRKQIEEALQNSAEWLRLAMEGSELGLWYWDEIQHSLRWDTKTREMFGAPSEGEVTLQTFIDALHPDDRGRVVRAWRDAVETGGPYEIEFRAVRPDGSVRWIHGRGKGHYNQAGKPIYMVGVGFDVSARKQAEQHRAELSGRLINAQEEERRHIAREIHDDFSQRLALLANELEMVRRVLAESSRAATERLQAMREEAIEIGRDLHALSHRLHSSKLEILGLARSIGSCCAEFVKQEGIQVYFGHNELPKSIPPDTALCLFRIFQEALRNVGKHSHATHVDVQLTGSLSEITLNLSDDGVGFEPRKIHSSDGIGISSMHERARMLGGRFEVRSQPALGTRIAVALPLNGNAQLTQSS